MSKHIDSTQHHNQEANGQIAATANHKSLNAPHGDDVIAMAETLLNMLETRIKERVKDAAIPADIPRFEMD